MRFLGVVLALVVVAAGALPFGDTVFGPSTGTCQARRRVRRPRITPAQRRAIVHRHARAPSAETRRWLHAVPQPLELRSGGAPAPFVLLPALDGTFDAAAMAIAEQALAYRVDGTTHPIHPRLVALVYAATRHFGVPYVHVISGYRSGNPSSRHAQGRAIDLVLPGVSDARLAAWLRPQGFVGVGIYPTSGFVHLDVRARSYFWRDLSGPSERNRERPMLTALGPRYDRAARGRGVEPVLDVSEGESETESESEGEGEGESEGESGSDGGSEIDGGSGSLSLDGGVP